MHKSPMSLRLRRQLVIKSVGLALLALLLLNPADLYGQMAIPLAIDENARVSASASSFHQFKSNMDGGGDVSITTYGIGVGGSMPLTDRTGIGARISYLREEYNFSQPNGLLAQNPWSQVNHLDMGLRLGYKLNEQWRIAVGPVAQAAGEDGARFGDSLMYGGVAAATYTASPNFMIGLGVGVFYRLEETRVFPSPVIAWKITDRLSLGNSYRLGVAGPAGLELSYTLDEHWEVAAGGGRRSSRFRLDKDGPTPGGIGENESWPVYARLSRKLGSVLHIDLYGGAAFGGKMTLQDSGGNDIRSVDYNTAPFIGLNLRAGLLNPFAKNKAEFSNR